MHSMQRVVLIILSLIAGDPVMAQSYPQRPLRWLIPSTPGDGSDTAARFVSDKLGAALGQPIVIENRPGAGGAVASSMAAKAPADGYTMIVGNAGSHGINAAIYTKLDFDVVRDFAPVALLCTAPNVMAVSATTPVRTVAEFIAYAKAAPGKLNYASGGVGSSAHLSAELFKSMTGVELTHIPYKGSSPAIAAVLAGETAVMIGNLPPWSAQFKAGKARALAVTTAARYAGLPEVPALAESLPGFETVAWFGVLAPSATPGSIIERVNREINAALSSDEVKTRFANTGCEVAAGSPESFAARIRGDVARWRKLAAEKNIRAD